MVRNEISLTSKPSFYFQHFSYLDKHTEIKKRIKVFPRQLWDAIIWRHQVLIGWGYGAEKCYIALFSFLFLIVFYLSLFRLPCEITMAESATI